MNTQITSFTTNSSSRVLASDLNLGWSAMPTFKLAHEEVNLGWDAMPAFGEAAHGSSNTEFVAQFLSATAHPTAPPADRPAFWSRIDAGGVFMMTVKLLAANAVITTGIGRPGSRP